MASKKSKGGQPGNLNALKHGFYSSQLQDLGDQDLDAALAEGLTDEIGMMRVMIRKLFSLADQEDVTLENWSAVVGAAGMAFTRLSGLIRTQKMLAGGQTDVASALSEALKEVTSGFRV